MYVYPGNDFVSAGLAAQGGGSWEQDELDNIQYALTAANRVLQHQRPLFVDVGANLGWFSMNAANLGARVYAFEGTVECAVMNRRISG